VRWVSQLITSVGWVGSKKWTHVQLQSWYRIMLLNNYGSFTPDAVPCGAAWRRTTQHLTISQRSASDVKEPYFVEFVLCQLMFVVNLLIENSRTCLIAYAACGMLTVLPVMNTLSLSIYSCSFVVFLTFTV